MRECVRLDIYASVGLRAYERGRICANIAGILKYPRNIYISEEYLNIGRIFKYHPMVLGDLGGMGVGSNARSRGKCQADESDGVRYMVFVLKTGKYGSENDFLIEN